MSNFINGENRILYFKINGNYVPIGCLRSNSFSESVDMIDTTTRDNKGWKTSKPTTQSYTLEFDAIQVNSTLVGGNFNVASYDKLKILKRNKVLLDWKLQGSEIPVVDYGQCYITSLSENNNIGEFMDFSGSLEGFGIPLIASLGTVILNNGNPNELISTDATGLELLRVSKF